ncbi:hypothetical protein U0070_009207 [Myodes glareolus]|uniref:Uncharacterized protein n=1 Tax=Myodes glareolus TaxID=447135 RepID=A0AAW0HKD4_MYOGA
MVTESTATAAITGELISADKIEDAPALSTSADKMESLDVAGEAKKLWGLEQKHLIMENIPLTVNAFQEAASLLDEETREKLREQVYDAMGGKEAKKAEGKSLSKPETGTEQESEVEKGGREDMDGSAPAEELQGKAESTSKPLTESSGEAKEAAIPALNEAEVASGKTERASLCAEEGKSVSGAYVQNKEFREMVHREKERK